MVVIKSFKHALAGIWFCVRHERNFRIHLFAALTVFLVMPYFPLTQVEKILVIITIFFVLALEMVNTAFEVLVNFISPKYNINAKHIKDLSAGAVSMVALGSLCVGAIIFWNPQALGDMFTDILGNWYKVICVVVYIILGIMFIWKTNEDDNIKQKNIYS